MLVMFLIQDVLKKIKFPADLLKIVIDDKGNKLPVSMVKLPTAIPNALCRLEMQDSAKLLFTENCKKSINYTAR